MLERATDAERPMEDFVKRHQILGFLILAVLLVAAAIFGLSARDRDSHVSNFVPPPSEYASGIVEEVRTAAWRGPSDAEEQQYCFFRISLSEVSGQMQMGVPEAGDDAWFARADNGSWYGLKPEVGDVAEVVWNRGPEHAEVDGEAIEFFETSSLGTPAYLRDERLAEEAEEAGELGAGLS